MTRVVLVEENEGDFSMKETSASAALAYENQAGIPRDAATRLGHVLTAIGRMNCDRVMTGQFRRKCDSKSWILEIVWFDWGSRFLLALFKLALNPKAVGVGGGRELKRHLWLSDEMSANINKQSGQLELLYLHCASSLVLNTLPRTLDPTHLYSPLTRVL